MTSLPQALLLVTALVNVAVLAFDSCRRLLTWRHLQKTGQNDEALLLVLVAKLLAIRLLLALGPDKHLRAADGDEQGHGPVAADNDDADPGEDLVHVVGAGDEAKAVAGRDLALGAARRAERRQVVVDERVARLAKEEEGRAGGVHGRLAGAGGERARPVDGDGAEEARQRPVEEAVLEDVGDGHGVGRELVDKGRLKLALEEVAHEEGKAEPLGVGHGLVAAGEDVGPGRDDGGVDEDRAKVLDEEDGAPRNLGA